MRKLGLLQQPEISSEFSIEVVPTSTGWPRSWRSRMSSMTASYFSLRSCRRRRARPCGDGRLVGRDHDVVEAVDLLELVGLGIGRAGHAGELAVHAEVVLEGDRGERLVPSLICTPSLASTAWCRPSLQRRPGHEAAGELVDDDDLAVLHHVVLVAVVEVVARSAAFRWCISVMFAGSYRLAPSGAGPPRAAALGVLVALLGQEDLVRLLVDREVAGS